MTTDADDPWVRQRTLLGEGQDRLAGSRALVVGCGGLGAGAIPALVAAGVGEVVLLDDDVVATSNLNRQTLYTSHDVGGKKVDRAVARMQALSPRTTVLGQEYRLTPDDASFVEGFDVVLDCTDRMASRVAISACCREAGVPWVWAAIDGWRAVLSVFAPGGVQWEDVVSDTAELPAPPQVLGTTATLAGAWQAAEAIKVLTGQGRTLAGRLQVVDLLAGTVREVPLAAR